MRSKLGDPDNTDEEPKMPQPVPAKTPAPKTEVKETKKEEEQAAIEERNSFRAFQERKEPQEDDSEDEDFATWLQFKGCDVQGPAARREGANAGGRFH